MGGWRLGLLRKTEYLHISKGTVTCKRTEGGSELLTMRGGAPRLGGSPTFYAALLELAGLQGASLVSPQRPP